MTQTNQINYTRYADSEEKQIADFFVEQEARRRTGGIDGLVDLIDSNQEQGWLEI